MYDKLLIQNQITTYEEELQKVNSAITNILSSGEESEITTQSGMGTKIRRVGYEHLIKRQQQLICLIEDTKAMLNGTSSRVSRIL